MTGVDVQKEKATSRKRRVVNIIIPPLSLDTQRFTEKVLPLTCE